MRQFLSNKVIGQKTISALIHKKRNPAKNDFRKVFYHLLNTAFYGKTVGNVKTSKSVIPFKKDKYVKMVKWQSNVNFIGFQKSDENYVTYTFKQNEVSIDKPVY